MNKKTILAVAAFCVLAFAGSVLAQPPGTQCIIAYDGYLQMIYDPEGTPRRTIYVDTLIMVTNGHPSQPMTAVVSVFDKYGEPVNINRPLLNGGSPWPDSQIPPNGSGWVALSQLVYQSTRDPYGTVGLAEKFSFRIYTNRPGGIINPVVEVKQVVYGAPVSFIGTEHGLEYRAIWQPKLFYLWTETSLGGKNGTGVLWEKAPPEPPPAP